MLFPRAAFLDKSPISCFRLGYVSDALGCKARWITGPREDFPKEGEDGCSGSVRWRPRSPPRAACSPVPSPLPAPQTLPPGAAAPRRAPAMYQRMLRCGAELGSPGGGGGGGAGGRLALLWIVPLTLSGLLGVAWGASSLGAHHIHHFHGSSKHHSVPIAIYRSPASLRGGHGGSEMPSSRGLLPGSPLSTLHSLLGP